MRSRARHLAASFLCALGCLPVFAQSTRTARRLDGHQVSLLAGGAKAAVLFFVASDCPVSNRYQPEMHRLEHLFADQGVAFWFVYPNLTETPSAIRAHQVAYDTTLSHVLTDADQRLAHLAGVKVTPQAAILIRPSRGSRELRTAYTGRIDDRYLSIGNERPQATRHDLELAIAATLTGQPVAPPTGPPVGCGIVNTR